MSARVVVSDGGRVRVVRRLLTDCLRSLSPHSSCTHPSAPLLATRRSGEQQQKLEQIHATSKEQDSVLDEISKGVDELKDRESHRGGWLCSAVPLPL